MYVCCHVDIKCKRDVIALQELGEYNHWKSTDRTLLLEVS